MRYILTIGTYSPTIRECIKIGDWFVHVLNNGYMIHIENPLITSIKRVS